MKSKITNQICLLAGCRSVSDRTVIQTLWSGYGTIERWQLEGGAIPSIIVKHINPPSASDHPGGWNTNLSHQRKLQSYIVESSFYENWAHRCIAACRVPVCYGALQFEEERIIILEDLDASGFPVRKSTLTMSELHAGLSWLANFHAIFLHVVPEGLWPVGTYWHLATRPDELQEMDDLELKKYAHKIDATLNSCKYQTFVHGDAKVANFCFGKGSDSIAAVDFQYAGGGCGMKDVAYFLSSCLDERSCEQHEKELLNFYFEILKSAISQDINFNALEKEWREMYPFVWTDFYRFLSGWMPGHWKMHDYSRKMRRETLNVLSI